MKIKIRFLVPVFFTLFLCISCSDNWLEPEPLSFFAPENVYVDEAGFESLLITMRKNLKREHYGLWNYTSAELSASDLAVGSRPDFSLNTPSSSDRPPYLSMYNEVFVFLKDAN